MKIYTKTGDRGETGLFDGTRVVKSDPRVDAYGDVDELHASLGVVRAAGLDAECTAMLEQIQRDLFAHRRAAGRSRPPASPTASRRPRSVATDVARLEGWIDTLEGELPPLTPLHPRRRIHRSAPACIWRARSAGGPNGDGRRSGRTRSRRSVLIYVNRLSDLLFVMARVVNRRAGATELEW